MLLMKKFKRTYQVNFLFNYHRYILLLFLFYGCEKKIQQADSIIIGRVFTMDVNHPWVDAVAIKDGIIIYVGSKEDVFKYKGDFTRIIINEEGMVLPGFIDTHVHLLWGGMEMNECRLNGLANKEQVLSHIENYIKQNPSLEWIRGYGWDLTAFQDNSPRKDWLDKITIDKPIFLYSYDAHSAWVNTKALELAGITENTPNPKNGIIEKDKNGKPTGLLREDAMELVGSLLPKYKDEEINSGLKLAIEMANAVGITSVFDAGLGPHDDLTFYQNASKDTSITMRISASQYINQDSWRSDIRAIKKKRYNYQYGYMNTIKIFADGTIESGTAALNEPYIGTNNYGILNWDPDTLKVAFSEFEKFGFQIHVHAIGDGGINATLDAFEYAKIKNGQMDRRHVISHVQLVNPNDIQRFAELNVSASFQSLWAYPDQYIRDLTIPVLGPIRSKWNYPLQSIVLAGGRIVGGSDWTVTSLNPLDAIEVAVTRRRLGDENGEALVINQAVDLETILRAYTIDAAYVIFKEDMVGSIELGKKADLVILDKNLFNIPKHEIHSTNINMTIFGGRIAYERK